MPSIVVEQQQGYIRFEVFPERVTFNGAHNARSKFFLLVTCSQALNEANCARHTLADIKAASIYTHSAKT